MDKEEALIIVVKIVSDIIDVQIDMMKLRRKVDLRIQPHPFSISDFNKENLVVDKILKSGILIKNNI